MELAFLTGNDGIREDIEGGGAAVEAFEFLGFIGFIF